MIVFSHFYWITGVTITCIEELRQLARKRVPKMFYDYVDAGSWTEYSYRANEADLRRLEFRQALLNK